MVKFFTLPPKSVKYPFILMNSSRPEDGVYYITYRDNARYIKELIIDSGVEVFRHNSALTDYPEGRDSRIAKQVRLWFWASGVLPSASVYAVVPDYPDDYHHKQFWISDKTNIERTVENILLATEKYPHVSWLIPIQGHYKSPKSVLRSLQLLYKRDFTFEKYDYYAIANLCVEPECRIHEFTVKYVWSWFKEVLGYVPKIHVFGPKLRCIPKIKQYIHSFDSMAWTKPVELGLHKKFPWSAKNMREREIFFIHYINRIQQLLR